MKRTHFVSFFAAFAAVLVLGLAGCNQPNSNNTASNAGGGDVASLAGKVWKIQIAPPPQQPGQPQGQGQDTEPDSYVVIDLEASKIHSAYKEGDNLVKLPDEDVLFKLKNKQITFNPEKDLSFPVTTKKSGTAVGLYMSEEGHEVKIATLSPAESGITVEQIKNAKQKGA